MKAKILDVLVCPSCHEGLVLSTFKKSGEEIVEGILKCRKCRSWYPIISGIPRMLPPNMINGVILEAFVLEHKDELPDAGKGLKEKYHDVKHRTSKSFGFQWNVFSEMFPEYEDNFLKYIEPLKPSFFKGKTVLDAGCGFGRHIYYAAKYGAEVIGFDLSDAVEAAYKNCKKFDNVHIVQGDIYNLPLRKKFDFIMSIGVLHHLPEPEKGYLKIVELAKAGTKVFAWLYGSEGRAFKTVFLESTIRKITVNMPKRMLYYFCYLPGTLYHSTNLVYKLLRKAGACGIAEKLPFKNYSRFPFRVKVADAYDFLGTPINNYYSRGECEKWAKDAKLRNISVTSYGGRSWRVFGDK